MIRKNATTGSRLTPGGAGALRRFLRVRRGLCAKCGYPMGGSPVCSECGKALSKGAVVIADG